MIEVEGQATDILQSKLGLKMELENLQKKALEEKPVPIIEDNSLELAKVGLHFTFSNIEFVKNNYLMFYFIILFILVKRTSSGGKAGTCCREGTF